MSDFDRDFWQAQWDRDPGVHHGQAHPYLEQEIAGLATGTALDAGCGEGAEAIWLAARGWSVTGADISARALERARARSSAADLDVRWVEADLGTWEPEVRYDLVTTFYAHPTMPQLAFYERIAEWVRPGGTLLIVGHGTHAADHGHAEHSAPPAHASVRAQLVVDALDPGLWRVETAEEVERVSGGTRLDDVVVRATRSEAHAG